MARRLPDDPIKPARGRTCPPDCTCKRHSRVAGPGTITADGYRILSAQRGHPLAGKTGLLLEHRKVLYNEIGPGPHPCHWLSFYGCGREALEWGGIGGNSIVADHLDGIKLNNDPTNLVPSCTQCNIHRVRGTFRLGLNQLDLDAIAALLACGKFTRAQIGELFGISPSAIDRIANGSWMLKEVTHGKEIA